jgi:hypothetical protein
MLASSTLAAQLPRGLALEAGAARLRLEERSGADTTLFSGSGFVVEGRLAAGPVGLELGYTQGTLESDQAGGPGRDVVEGRALLGVRPVSWLELAVGAHARAYLTPAGTVRWTFWRTRARAEGALLTPMLRTYLELWAAPLTSVNEPEGGGAASGGEGGLRARIPGSPVWVRLAYAIDRAALKGDARVETLDGVILALGVGGR